MSRYLYYHPVKPRRPGSFGFSKLSAMALLLVALMGMPSWLFAQPAAESAAARSYAIAAGPLGPALEQFARHAGINLSYDAALVDSTETAGLSGTFTIEAGLSALLTGSSITAEEYSGGWLLRRLPPAPAAPSAPGKETDDSDTVVLPSLRVSEAMAANREISIEQAQRILASDMADVLSATPSISVGGGARNAQRIYLRGIAGANLNITIDGARQGRPLFQHRGSLGGLDPDLLKRVEISTGADADSGPGALGGSIRFETLDAQDLLGPNRTTGLRLKVGYGSVDETLQGSTTAYALLGEKLGILAHMSGSDRENYETGDGTEVLNTAGEDRDYLLKLSLLDLAGHSLRMGAERNTAAGDANWGGAGSDMGAATDTESAVRQETERSSYSLDHRFLPEGLPLVNWKLNLYHNENLLENTDADNTVTSSEFGGAVKNTAAFELGPTTHRLTVSMDYFREEGTYETGDGEIGNDSDTLGLVLQERMDIGRVGLTVGARFDDYSADYGPETVSGNELSPNVSGEVELVRGLTVFAGYSEAVRGSSIIPIQWLSLVSDDVVINHGNTVEPEESVQREGGVRYGGSDLLLGEDYLSAELTLFDTRLKNTLEVEEGGRRGAPITAIYNNPETLRSKGYEVKVVWGYRQVETRVSFSSFRTEDSDGNPVGNIRRKTGATGDQLVWDTRWRPRANLTLGYTLNFVADLTDVPEGDDERPGYTLHGVQASWQPQLLPALTLSLAVDNLLDEHYRRQTSFKGMDADAVAEPGRDIRLAMTYRF